MKKVASTTTKQKAKRDPKIDPVFDAMVESIQAYLDTTVSMHGPHLFEVETKEDLYELYLNNLPKHRQHHTCHCCKTFIQRYGYLAVVTDTGELVSPIWSAKVPEFYAASCAAMSKAIHRGRITTVAFRKEEEWGELPLAYGSEWTHFAIDPPSAVVFKASKIFTAGQAMAIKREDHGCLCRGLAEYPKEAVGQAVSLLKSDTLYRSEKVIGPAMFLLETHELFGRDKNKSNLIWKQVAKAPMGFCQPKSTMIGTLLDDLCAGVPLEVAKRKFGEKMHPGQYQRPQAAPSAGNIAVAEKLVKDLGLAPAFERRFARLEEIETLWRPKEYALREEGFFGHLKAKNEPPKADLHMAPVPITWEKFEKTVLPEALKMEVYLVGKANLTAIVTATHADAPPILQWDSEEKRNPFSQYLYIDGSNPSSWGLPLGSYIEVTAVTLRPSMWYRTDPNNKKSAIFILKGCRDMSQPGLCLFPETLKSELHGVRSVIEAHSKTGKMTGVEEATACGLMTGDGISQNYTLRVTTKHGAQFYVIDRWD